MSLNYVNLSAGIYGFHARDAVHDEQCEGRGRTFTYLIRKGKIIISVALIFLGP